MSYIYDPITETVIRDLETIIPGTERITISGYKNRIINGDFTVMQRGQKFIIQNNKQYTFDRWLSGAFDDNKIECLNYIEIAGEAGATVDVLDILGDGSCLACWPLDGNGQDLGGNYNCIENNIVWGMGKFGGCIDYYNKGTGSWLRTENKVQRGGTNEFTVSLWIYVYGHIGAGQNIFHLTPDGKDTTYRYTNQWKTTQDNSRQPGIWLVSTDNRQVVVENGFRYIANTWYRDKLKFLYANTLLNYRQWHNITVTIDRTHLKLYIDGTFDNEVEATESNYLYHNDGWVYIGNQWTSKNYKIDQVRIFNKVLQPFEIQSLVQETGKSIVEKQSCKITLLEKGTSNRVIPLEQRIEGNMVSDILIKKSPVTISFKLASNKPRNIEVSLKYSDDTVYRTRTLAYTGNGEYQTLSVTFDLIDIDIDKIHFYEKEAFRVVIGENCLEDVGDWIKVNYVQLEEGDVATAYEYIPPDMQRIRCLRYYRYSDDGTYSYNDRIIPMRTIPTILSSPYRFDAEL